MESSSCARSHEGTRRLHREHDEESSQAECLTLDSRDFASWNPACCGACEGEARDPQRVRLAAAPPGILQLPLQAVSFAHHLLSDTLETLLCHSPSMALKSEYTGRNPGRSTNAA